MPAWTTRKSSRPAARPAGELSRSESSHPHWQLMGSVTLALRLRHNTVDQPHHGRPDGPQRPQSRAHLAGRSRSAVSGRRPIPLGRAGARLVKPMEHHPTNGTVAYVAGLGASLGLVHVLTGPDHLSAIATLASGSRGRSRSFLLGIRWGFGHSLGIVLIFAIFMLVPDFNIESISKSGDIVAGVIMMLLGFFGIFRARRKYFVNLNQGSVTAIRDEIHEHDKSESLSYCMEARSGVEGDLTSGSLSDQVQSCSLLETDRPAPAIQSEKTDIFAASQVVLDLEKDTVGMLSSHRDSAVDDGTDITPHDDRTVSPWRSRTFPCALCSRSMDLILAIVVGIFHGVAGAGGVLAVIPAISMKHDSNMAAAYLIMFFGTSILAMGVLATLWGELSGRMGSTALLEYRIAVAASLFSVAVGIIWEVLLGLDMLDTVFH
jgi:hypothetical protein